MPERPWDQQLKEFLKRTGDDLKKTGEEIRAEAQKLIEDVRDPDTQQRIKDGLGNIGTWAKRAAEDAAGKIEDVVKRADDAWTQRKTPAKSAGSKPKKARKAAKKPAKAAKSRRR